MKKTILGTLLLGVTSLFAQTYHVGTVIDDKNFDILKSKQIIDRPIPSVQYKTKTYSYKLPTQYLMGYQLAGWYSSNSENKKWFSTTGVYYNKTLNNGWSFSVDPEFTFIKKSGSADVRQKDLTISVNKYDYLKKQNGTFTFHYMKDNQNDKVYAYMYKYTKYYYPFNISLLGAWQSYKTDEGTNHLFTLKPEIGYYKILRNGVRMYVSAKYDITKQTHKWAGTNKYMQGVTLNSVFSKGINSIKVSCFLGNVAGIVTNNGYVVYNTTNIIQEKIGLKYNKKLKNNWSVSFAYGFTRYKITKDSSHANLQDIGIFIGKSF